MEKVVPMAGWHETRRYTESGIPKAHDFIPCDLTARGTGERLVTKDERTGVSAIEAAGH